MKAITRYIACVLTAAALVGSAVATLITHFHLI